VETKVQALDAVFWKVDQVQKKLASVPHIVESGRKTQYQRLAQRVGKAFLTVECGDGREIAERIRRVSSRVDESEQKLRVVPEAFARVRSQMLATQVVRGLAEKFQRQATPDRLAEQLARLTRLSDRVSAVEKRLSAVPPELQRQREEKLRARQAVRDFAQTPFTAPIETSLHKLQTVFWKFDQQAKKVLSVEGVVKDARANSMQRLASRVSRAFVSLELDNGAGYQDRLARIGARVDEVEKRLQLVPGAVTRLRNQKLATSTVMALVADFQKKAGPQRLEAQLDRLAQLSQRVGAIEGRLQPMDAEFKRRDRESQQARQAVRDFASL